MCCRGTFDGYQREINQEASSEMTEINADALRQVEEALVRYSNVCDANLGTPDSRNTYYGHADRFVRWLKGEFVPGKMKSA